jgi:MFS family permease
LVTLDLSQSHLSLVFSIYGVFQVTGSIAVMLLQTWPLAAQLTTPQQYWVVVTAVCGAMGASLLMTLQPAVFPLLLVARSAQGLFGAVYAIYAMVLMARTFPMAWMLQAVAVMTAGGCLGLNMRRRTLV